MEEENNVNTRLIKVIQRLLFLILVLVLLLVALPILFYYGNSLLNLFSGSKNENPQIQAEAQIQGSTSKTIYWQPQEIALVTNLKKKELLLYGKELIIHTASYFGPNGSIQKEFNGMNCQNCHLDAGTKVFGNNYGSVAANYPKFRARSGTIESITKRINDCFERSLNGKSLDSLSKEMIAMRSYIEFLGGQVEKGTKAPGSGFKNLTYLNRACDPILGKKVYIEKCQSCHLKDGEGVLMEHKLEYQYPPLWGKYSYNDGAGLYRIINFAKYVKYNMPLGANHESPQLSDEEAWDVASFINSQQRPHKNTAQDWPDLTKKPVDHPFGPYADNFTEREHKYGPFAPIEELQKQKTIKK
jgi:thiosulfate dehydrogenase